jgi:hypothetical protein
LALSLTGCNAARSLIATPNDYADYRRVRLAKTFDERLAAAWHYLATRPNGRYAERLRGYLEAAEPVYYKVRAQTAAGLEAYLAAMPDGPHAKEALDSLIVKRNEARREELAERATKAMLLKIEAEEKSRKGVATMVEWWVRSLLDPAPWRGTFSDAPAELLARFRLSAPSPECTEEEGAQQCKKTIERTFRIRHEAGEKEEKLVMTIEVWLDAEYHLQKVRLSGPLLALRTSEASQGESSGGTPKEVARAWRALIERLNGAIMADNRICNGGEDAAEVLTLTCDDPGVSLTVAPGWQEGSDAVTIARAGAH